MHLFFDGVSSRGYIGLFNSGKEVINSTFFEIQGNESTKTIPLIDIFLKENNTSYQDIENIALVVGPGSFTGIRTISLVVNTLSYIYPHLLLTPVSFFDLYASYPIVKSSSKRDLFVKYSNSATIEVVKNEDFQVGKSGDMIYGDVDITKITGNAKLYNIPDYDNIFKNLELLQKKRVAPLYIKKPNIS